MFLSCLEIESGNLEVISFGFRLSTVSDTSTLRNTSNFSHQPVQVDFLVRFDLNLYLGIVLYPSIWQNNCFWNIIVYLCISRWRKNISFVALFKLLRDKKLKFVLTGYLLFDGQCGIVHCGNYECSAEKNALSLVVWHHTGLYDITIEMA